MLRFQNLKSYAAALLLLGVLAGWTQWELGAQTEETGSTFEGVISDSSCGTQHKMENAKECIEACMGSGGSYVLVVGDVVHSLEGNA